MTPAAGKAWYDALFQQYADWGVDFVKIDDMLNNNTKVYHQAEADAIRAAVDKTGRSIVLSFSPGPDDPSWLPNSVQNLNANANMWRVVNDFWDYNALTDLEGVFEAASTWQGVDDLIPGHWPDLDMLPLGYLGPRNEWHASGQTTFTRNEQVSIMTLWAMLPSPLMYGGNPAELSVGFVDSRAPHERGGPVGSPGHTRRSRPSDGGGSRRNLGARPERRSQGRRLLQPR